MATHICFLGWAHSLRCTGWCGSRGELTKNLTAEFWEAQLLAALCTEWPASFSVAGLIYCPWLLAFWWCGDPSFAAISLSWFPIVHFIHWSHQISSHSPGIPEWLGTPFCIFSGHLYALSFSLLLPRFNIGGSCALFVFLSLHYFA